MQVRMLLPALQTKENPLRIVPIVASTTITLVEAGAVFIASLKRKTMEAVGLTPVAIRAGVTDVMVGAARESPIPSARRALAKRT